MFENRQGIVIGCVLACSLMALIIVVIAAREAKATDPPGTLCLIIVSGSQGYSASEVSKSTAFYEYSLDKYGEDNVVYLTSPSHTGSDGEATIANIESAFDWLYENSLPTTEIVIYVSDHEKRVFNESFFEFNDGNISIATIDNWINQISFDDLTFIANGERSGLTGPDLSSSTRDIICSMGSIEYFNPDCFNITRSLEDPTADTNNDNIVSYVEAFWKEVDILEESGQDPVFYR